MPGLFNSCDVCQKLEDIESAMRIYDIDSLHREIAGFRTAEGSTVKSGGNKSTGGGDYAATKSFD
jgi:hypothetical protein